MSSPEPPDRLEEASPGDPPHAHTPGGWAVPTTSAAAPERPTPGTGEVPSWGAWPAQGYGPGQGHGPPRGDGPPLSNGLATAGLVLGVVAIVLFWTVVFGLILGVLAVVFGAIGMKRASTLPGRHLRGRGLAGVITGVAAIVLSGGFLVLALVGFVSEIDSDPADGTCDEGRFLQDPDC